MMLHHPQYVGFWKRSGETEETFVPQSLFLMFVEGEGTEDNWKSRKISGSIQDSFGTAYFNGDLINNNIDFKKYYLVLANEESPFPPFETLSEIRFSGKKVGEIPNKKQVFEGIWKDSTNKGIFTLEKYTPFFSDYIDSTVVRNSIESEIKWLQIKYYGDKIASKEYSRKFDALLRLIGL